MNALMAARNVIRAVMTNNKFLLRRVMHDHKHIPSLDMPWSAQCPIRPLQIIMTQANLELMKEFCDVDCGSTTDSKLS